MKDPSPQVFVTAVNLDSNREYVLPFNDVQERRWKHFYGVLPDLCCIIWRKLDAHNSIHGGDFKHLMWALYFLKVYGKEEDNSNYSGGVDEKTFRKWTHIFVEAISFLESSVVSDFFPILCSVTHLSPQRPHLSLSFCLHTHATDNLGCTDHRRQPVARDNRWHGYASRNRFQ